MILIYKEQKIFQCLFKQLQVIRIKSIIGWGISGVSPDM